MWGKLLEWSKTPGSWGIALLIIVGFVSLLGYMGAPIPKPAWASDLKAVAMDGKWRDHRFYRDLIQRQEDRIFELEKQRSLAPEDVKPTYDELIGSKKRTLRDDTKAYKRIEQELLEKE